MDKMIWTPPILDLSVDRYVAWKAWLAKWNDYFIMTELGKKAPEYQCAMLRYTFTDETRNIYDTLGLSENDANDVTKIMMLWKVLQKELSMKLWKGMSSTVECKKRGNCLVIS